MKPKAEKTFCFLKGIAMDKVKIAFIGFGARGDCLLKMILETMPNDVEIVGVCDSYEDRALAAKKMVEEIAGSSPVAVTDYRKLLEMKEVEAVISPSAWDAHIQIAIDSMLAGKYVATEVGGAYSIQQCWDLVHTYERTGVPMMLLENCCYGKNELTVFNMVKKGLFGEVVHCEGGYRHDLRDEIALGEEHRHYRLENFKNRNGELYPTHELGPIAKCLDINRGNRMLYLTSMASKARGVNDWIKKNRGEDFPNANYEFAMGDVVTTMIKCAHGETITLTHDTSLPRAYSRGNLVQGTNAIWSEDKNGIVVDVVPAAGEKEWKSIEEYYGEYMHPLWKEYIEQGVVSGHDGIDYLTINAFINAVRNHTQTPIDVYDAAAWMAVTTLSEDSIAMGSMPVAIPDFTNGKWIKNRPIVRSKYCLDDICTECF